MKAPPPPGLSALNRATLVTPYGTHTLALAPGGNAESGYLLTGGPYQVVYAPATGQIAYYRAGRAVTGLYVRALPPRKNPTYRRFGAL